MMQKKLVDLSIAYFLMNIYMYQLVLFISNEIFQHSHNNSLNQFIHQRLKLVQTCGTNKTSKKKSTTNKERI